MNFSWFCPSPPEPEPEPEQSYISFIFYSLLNAWVWLFFINLLFLFFTKKPNIFKTSNVDFKKIIFGISFFSILFKMECRSSKRYIINWSPGHWKNNVS